MSRYEEALVELHRAPHNRFVAERKRLADELARGGDKGGATLLGKRTRPSVSAWAVNQLYWEARHDFDELFATAARVREGDLAATAAHRKATTKLTTRATTILGAAGHAASEATLRRITATLSALAAAGGFEPDLPGALASDRDPPGFDAAGIEGWTVAPVAPKQANGSGAKAEPAPAARALVALEKRRAAEEEARKRAEQRRLEGLLRTAKAEVEKLTRERDERRRDFEEAEAKLSRALTAVLDFETRLANSGPAS